MDPKSKEFLELQAKWYKRLEKDGFEDAEQLDGNLKLWASSFFKVRHNETLFTAKEEYFRLAGFFLNDYAFESKLERKVWELHSEGLGRREIVKRLKSLHFKAYSSQVQKMLERLKKEMINRCNQS